MVGLLCAYSTVLAIRPVCAFDREVATIHFRGVFTMQILGLLKVLFAILSWVI